MFLHFTEAPMYILNHDVYTLLSVFSTKGFLYYILEWSIKSFMEWLLSYVDM